ncbi:MAG: RNA modification enzyme, MiaB family, bifunctional enzyme involved in thiolation and methylation of tRNA [Candidatus Collierbacteria bacterium GW2011_GWC1_45_47]|uniref:tRNA-2-methylthio-N(6)-dimethylallyladenosine synthase n=5 Tax=Candidatus Collieribacteriota TaxID=1752725 RepID=A0A0G1HGI4_9BACT|nr:MAG: (Dimethylallyl)adenosine tRNA methylthiotransferase MiaB [Candidatus Collierbacteria bacterium GW2011_GWA1_44_12]KKT38813.1 MAG: (Dimethylallyl)adenosine tRNA methylthiotransferase MiaB [Candidatus Collierbacteria bacterium GW2011_GWF1_44_12]KKT46426.1 MAG: (Dimethylallyl)adenosine tRNA methylthiotransferase MiaB [Candidatus Collierbacteria bacterium GW2011_GWF2_44_15]KKU00429.1 MAG: (Dimethylallyl)adenosine tRNA methylthiotransferase MiaB [Candidatus Collierbacteria bacterium GW2011_GWC
MPLVHIKTFGCQANKSDSERILGDYFARGFSETDDWKKADEIVINTCSVRRSAEDRVRGFINNINKFFATSSKPKIILTGCMLFRSEAQIRELLPEVDEVLPINEVGFNQQAIRKDKIHAWVPVSSGCNSFCTYCIVPYSRGREVSRPEADIVLEVENLAKIGFTEITLLGQNVNSYGLEKEGIALRKLYMESHLDLSSLPSNQSQYKKAKSTPPFVILLQKISKIDQIKKISFFTSNPWDFYDELIDEIAKNPKIDRFIHLPVQSGSNRILEKMNRGYTRESYLALVSKIKTKIPEAVFGTDIIVGFPTETDEDFHETVNLVKQIGFKVGFVARYSPRPGTVSSKLFPDDVSPAIKKMRWEILDKIINKDNLSVRPIVP